MFKKNSKKILTFSLLAGVLLIARFVLAQDFGTEIVNNSLDGTLGQSNTDPRELAARIINIALGFLSVIAVGIVLYSGFLWMTSNGEEDKVTRAKQILKNGIIGLVIVLASWGIATFVISKLSGSINGKGGNEDGGGCPSGMTSPCGCGGSMLCTDGSYDSCIGSNPEDCSNPPTSCDSSSTPGCQAVDQICADGYFCDNSCLCQKKAELGDSCDANLNNSTCDADSDKCSEYLTCNPNTCTCDGPPAITGISPVGGFCNLDINKACSSDDNCNEGDSCNLNTANGTINNFITISGKNFGEYSATNSKVYFTGKANATPVNGMTTGADPVEPPIGSTSGNESFEEIVEAISPSTVNPLCIGSWRNDQIVIAVPSGVQTGAIKVVNKDNLADVTNNDFGPKIPDFVSNNINRPGLCNIDPIKGSLSSEVNYQGVNLYSGKAYFGNYKSNVGGLYSNFNNPAGLSGTSTIPNIKEGESGSFVETLVSGSIQKSNYLKFVKDPEEGDGPYIMSFSPSEGSPGQYITVKGSGFGGAKGASKVYFVSGLNKIEASYAFPAICANSVWTNNQIIIKVPSSIANEIYQIEIVLSEDTISTINLNPNVFTVNSSLTLKPSLCKIDPEKGPIDTPVTLWGEYFGLKNNNGLVKFNYNQTATGVIKQEKEADIINTNIPKAAITGPVKIIKNSVSGNELNFLVSECTKDEECNNQVCCPQNTYRKGRCVSSLNDCFIDIPTSIFEWSFSTSFDASTTPTFSSCLGLSKYLGSCYQGAMCPNSPGACSSPSTSYDKIVGSCDLNCNNVPGCTSATCSYDQTLDKCVNKLIANCDLPVSTTFKASDYSAKILKDFVTEKVCNEKGKWQISSPGSCPIGWTRGAGDICVQTDSNCNLCSENLNCQKVGAVNKCVSDELCKDKGASCFDNLTNLAETDNCVIKVEPSCECCCRIGKDSEDCCAPLTCAGKCGSDVTANTNTYGSCSGCAAVGSTQDSHDAACNCSSSSGKFCSISANTPQGICTDCAGITDQATCGDHSSSCCWDANKTADTTADDFCRGVESSPVLSKDKNSPDYGFCGYFACQKLPADPLVCASATPVKVAYYAKAADCIIGCPKANVDICSNFKDKDTCSAESNCCFDAKKNKCISGSQISDGLNNGFCAYYDCQKLPDGDPYSCNLNATTTGRFANTTSCSDVCGNPPGGAGLGCISSSNSETCDFNLCSATGLACLQDTKDSSISVGGAFPSCGTCCCQPKTDTTADSCVTPETPLLVCQPNQGACSGASRGLCCGCKQDSDCGSVTSTGCGTDTCCEARPSVASTSPAASATNICRNAAIKISFNQKMNANSFVNNFLLFEEKTYGNGVCPAGTFLADAETIKSIVKAQNKNIIARIWENVSIKFLALFNKNGKQVLALAPDSAKLYCSVPGTVNSEYDGIKTSLVFTPAKALSPSTRHYVVVKGDEILNSQTGVLSASQIGMNERGFRDSGETNFTNPVKLNNQVYTNAYSFQFVTLSDQGVSAGICAIDHVTLNPSSYLFKTTVNDVNEKDELDNVNDRDKVFVAGAYSVNNQLLTPIAGYNWDWDWVVTDTSVVDILNIPGANTLNASSRIVAAKSGVTDAQTRISATVNMNRYISNCGSYCNAFSMGNRETDLSDVYVFVCANPWPAPKADGSWLPWGDVSANCSQGAGSCEGYNYKFYYCRDAGNSGTLDDLPAINDSPISRSGSLLCSSNNTPCSGLNTSCDSNKGICVWNVLKESYFFRAAMLDSAVINNLIDTRKGGEVQIYWRSPSSNVSSYKVYYLKSGKGVMLSKEFNSTGSAGVCSFYGQDYVCTAKINGLVDGQDYIFKISVISNNKTESSFSNEVTARTSDKTIPIKPIGLKANISNSAINFSWAANTDDTINYRLYHGLISGKYAESIDSAGSSNTISSSFSQTEGLHYFALSALDNAANESLKSTERVIYFSTTTAWIRTLDESETQVNTECLVKMDIDPANSTKAICSDNLVFKNPGYFKGIIVNTGTPYCQVNGCDVPYNPNKCRYHSGSWSNNCFVLVK